MQGYEGTASNSSTMTHIVGLLVCIAWVAPCPNNIGGKDCILILKVLDMLFLNILGSEGYNCCTIGTIVASYNT